MTQTNQSDKSSLSPEGMKVVLAAQNIVYDPQGVDMLKQALANTKSEKAITPTVVMAATTLLHKMGDKVDSLPEEEMWGKHGVVHVVLDSLYEVAKGLGYKAPRSDLQQAYEMVETQLEQSKQQPDQEQGEAPDNEQQEMQPPGPMQGAMTSQAAPAQAGPPTSPMQGAMP